MAIASEVWETARTIWENTPDISYSELVEKLIEIFGEENAPASKSAVATKAKKENWKKKSKLKKTERKKERTQSFENKDNKGNNKVIPVAVLNAKTKIEREMDSLVLNAEQKRKIIQKHRKRLEQLGDLQDSTIDTVNMLHGLDPELDGEKIQKVIVISETLSRTLNQLTASQKMIAEQEFVVCGITVDDFKESEQQKRMATFEALEQLDEMERVKRQQINQELKQRLREFELMAETGDYDVVGEDE